MRKRKYYQDIWYNPVMENGESTCLSDFIDDWGFENFKILFVTKGLNKTNSTELHLICRVTIPLRAYIRLLIRDYKKKRKEITT